LHNAKCLTAAFLSVFVGFAAGFGAPPPPKKLLMSEGMFMMIKGTSTLDKQTDSKDGKKNRHVQ
jgi:hypothetical protein